MDWIRSRTAVVVLTVLLAVSAVGLPIFIAIQVAHSQAVAAERDRVESYSREVLRRMVASADQGDLAIKQLVSRVGPGGDPCSERARALMRALDLSSQYIQAVGAMSGNKLVCSSLGEKSLSLDLGAPDLTSPAGVQVRNHVTFDFDVEKTVYIVNERDGFAVILNRDLVIDVAPELGIALGTFTYPAGEVTRSRGRLDRAWITRTVATLPKDGRPHARSSTFVTGDQLVSITTSPTRYVGAVSAISTGRVDDRARDTALVLVPLGAFAGLLLAGAVLYLARLQLALPSVIKTALRSREFFLHYQPVIDLRTGRWVGAEALIRWQRPNGQMVRPDVFVPVAEDAGLSRRLTAKVFDLLEPDLRTLATTHPDFVIALNVTAADLQTTAIVDACRQLLARTGARPGSLSIEATERGFLDPQIAAVVVRDLRELGVRVAIDDFGTGYSSLSYLQTLEIDTLKIDKSFVDTIGTDAPTRNVVFHIIEMAKALDLSMVAEGVEHESQAAALRAQGVEYAQGWFYSAALPFDELLARLATAGDDVP